MAINNCTISSHNQIESFGDNWGQGQIGAIQLTITPDPGFVVSAQNFSWVDVGVTFDTVQPNINQFRYVSESDTFVYNLNQLSTFESAEVPNQNEPIFIQLINMQVNDLQNLTLETVLDNDTSFPKYVTFSNSTTPNATDNEVIVNVEMYDGFTMPNGNVSMTLDVNGVATPITIVNENIDEDDSSNNNDTTAGEQFTLGTFSITPVFVTGITAQYPGSTFSTGQPGNSNIPDGSAFTTTWTSRARGLDLRTETEEVSIPSDSSVITNVSESNPLLMPYYVGEGGQLYQTMLANWNNYIGDFVQGQLNGAPAFYNYNTTNEFGSSQGTNNEQWWSVQEVSPEYNTIIKSGIGKLANHPNVISDSFPYKTSDLINNGAAQNPSYRQTISSKYGDVVDAPNVGLSNLASKKLIRPAWESTNESNQPNEANWQGGRVFGFIADSNGGILQDQQTEFQPFQNYSQTQNFFIRAVDGYAINKNRFTFPFGLSDRGYITGQIAKGVNPAQSAPQYAVNEEATANDQTSGYTLGTTFGAGTYEYYLKTLFQGDQSVSGLYDESGFNMGGNINENMPTLVREPVVFLSNKLSEKRTDIIEYIQFQNSTPFILDNPFSLLSNEFANNPNPFGIINQFVNYAGTLQNSYETWQDNIVQVTVKFNEDFTHNFTQSDGTLFPHVKILIPFDPRVITGSGVTTLTENVAVALGMAFNSGSQGVQGLLIESTTDKDNIFTQTIVNRRGESNEETVLRIGGYVAPNVRSVVNNFKITAPTGKYFYRQPSFEAENDLTNKTVKIETTGVEKDANNRIISYSYAVKYKNKNKVSLSDNIKYNITPYCFNIPQDDGIKLIRSVDVGRKSIRSNGGRKKITVKGDVGAEFEIQVNKQGKVLGGLDGATILNSQNINYYEKEFLAHNGKSACLRGKINKNGEYKFYVNIPKVTSSTEYKVIIESAGTSKLSSGLQDVYTINQFADTVLTFSCTDSIGVTTISANVVKTGPPNTDTNKLSKSYSYTPNSTVTFTITSSGGVIQLKGSATTPLFLQEPTIISGVIKSSDFTNSNPDLNGGTDIQITNINFSGLGTTSVTLTYNLNINKFGTSNTTFNLDLDNFIRV
jgi:hypothetical protein